VLAGEVRVILRSGEVCVPDIGGFWQGDDEGDCLVRHGIILSPDRTSLGHS